MFGYHPYDINSNTPASQIKSSLQSIANYNTKPNIMTEYSDNLSWFNTALFIHNTLVYANSSGYIYWKLVWAQPAVAQRTQRWYSSIVMATISSRRFIM